MICVDKNYSTTRLLTREQPIIENKLEDKFENVLFLPEGEGRKGEGGLRTQGYFKKSHTDKLLITVVTVVFNGEQFLEETIQSVINQTYDNVEYIIIDGGSTDGTLDIIRQYEYAIDYWVSEQDGGVYAAWNKAVSLSRGDWVSFLGADDYMWEVQVLEQINIELKVIPSEVRVVYGQIMLLNHNGEVLHAIGDPWKQVKECFKHTMSIPHPSVMHRRDLFEQYGGFDESFYIAGDYEFLLRELKTRDAYFIPGLVVVAMRQGGVSSVPENALAQLHEVRRAQILSGQSYPSWRWLMSVCRVYIRLFLWIIVGDKAARKLLDFGRRIMKQPSFWTKT